MSEFIMVLVLFSAIVLVTTACSRIQSKSHDARRYELKMSSTEDECRINIDIHHDIGDADDDIEINPPGAGG
jgi:hypothetical protein